MINRLLGIIYILLNKGTVTAGELAERFEVSVRTVYRDVENLSMAGIPVYARKGKGGGISLTERFVLDKLLISGEEQVRILAALASLEETGAGDEGQILCKLGDFFKTEPVNWVSIDFSDWSGRRQEMFGQIKEAILNRQVMEFDYYGQSGEMSSRTVEPVQLLFKDYTWYVRAFCRVRGAMRLFKVMRMKRVRVLDEVFERDESRVGRPETDWGMQETGQGGTHEGEGGTEEGNAGIRGDGQEKCQPSTGMEAVVSGENLCLQIVLWIDKKEAYRIYDRLDLWDDTVLRTVCESVRA